MNFPDGAFADVGSGDIVFDETTAPQTPEAPDPGESPADGGDTDIDIENLDVDTLPAEQQDLGRKLKAGFTKKTQALAAERQALQDKAKKYDDLESMIADPAQRKIFLAALTANGGGENGGTAPEAPWGDIDPSKEFQPDVHKAIQKTSYDVMSQVLTPILQQFDAYKRKIDTFFAEQDQAKTVGAWDGIAKGFSNADQFKADAVALAQRTGIPLEQALYAVGGPKLLKASTAKDSPPANTQIDKRRSVLTKNGAPAANGRATIGRRSMLDILLETKKEFGMK